ncbi:ribosome-associated translation inhibitor RaiA [Candidatus Saccharibacteria bacterium]|nr:ribosome-associated translation inhibitor RaiA [Candidatus Saccharibacteria bacterium]
MISKLDITGSNFKLAEVHQKYAQKKIGKLDKYLPKSSKKEVVAKVVITETNRNPGNKYEVSAAMEIPGGKVIAAKDDCSNIFAGLDLVEAKLLGQIRRYKTETENSRPKKSLKNLFHRNR